MPIVYSRLTRPSGTCPVALLTCDMPADLTNTQHLDDAIAFRVLVLARHLRYSFARILVDWESGLSPEQFFLLFRLAEQDGRAQRELVDPNLNDRANITRLLTGLAERGLIERRSDAHDGRIRRIFLTPAGRALFASLRPRIAAERQHLFAGISHAELAVFASVLDTLTGRAIAGARKKHTPTV